MRIALSIGSNLGDRRAALDYAVAGLAGMAGVEDVRVSSVYETDPVGGVDQPDFLNVVAIADFPDGPEELVAASLLDLARQVEAALDRRRTVRWGPRTVDVDILAVGGWTSSDPDLTVPHPRLAERAFVLVPWAEVDPDFAVPDLGAVSALLAALPASEVDRVRQAS